MSLPLPPRLDGIIEKDIEKIQLYLYEIVSSFDNAVGEAIDPTLGRGGSGALNIVSAPENISYSGGSGLSIDETLFGHIDITFNFPLKAVDVLAFYKESTIENFNVFILPISPYRIPNLKVGTSYHIQLAGRSANGIIGPKSNLETVTISSSSVVGKAPADAQYIVGLNNDKLTNERLVTNTTTISWDLTNPSQAKVDVNNNSLDSLKKLDLLSSTTAITLTGNNVAGEILFQDVVVTHNLNKRVLVNAALESIANETNTARFTGVIQIANTLNSFTIRVTGAFFSSVVNITANLVSRYW